MPARDHNLRQRYINAAAKVRGAGLPVTIKNLAEILDERQKTLLMQVYRHPELVEAAGITLQVEHALTDYVETLRKILNKNGRASYGDVASMLGIKLGPVSGFLRKHRRAIEDAIPGVTWLEEKGRGHKHFIILKRPTFKKGQEIPVTFFDEHSGRVIFTAVRPAEYIRLWDAKLLKFQQEGTPMPYNLPTREEALRVL